MTEMAFPITDILLGLGLPGVIILFLGWTIKMVVTRYIKKQDDREEKLEKEVSRLQILVDGLQGEVREQLEERIGREQVVNNQLAEMTQQTQLVAVKLGDNSAKALAVVHELMRD